MVAVIGRRRVGKTFLVRTTFGEGLDVEITGSQHASKAEQLKKICRANTGIFWEKSFEGYA